MEKKLCPISELPCEKAKCVWWQEGDCSVNHIAVALAVISEELVEVRRRR